MNASLPILNRALRGLFAVLALSTAVSFVHAQSSPHVGVNKDFVNNTGQTVNDFEWLAQGSYTSVISHYDGPFPGEPNSTFTSFTITPSGPNTLFTWSGTSFPPGATAHVGLTLAGTNFTTLGVFWTLNGTPVGCVHQVPIGQGHSHMIVGQPSQVAFDNVAQNCESVPLYIGNVAILWYAQEVPLANLNVGLTSSGITPISTQSITGITLVPPGGESIVSVPNGAPAGANFAVVEYTVSSSSTLASPANTADFAQYQVVTPPATAAHVGVNKDFVNNTGQTVNDFEWLVQGPYANVISHYDGPFPGEANSTFTSFTITPVGANTLFTWSGTSFPPGATAHVGITLTGSDLITLGTNWTINGANAGCVHQIPIGQGHSHMIVGQPGQVAFDNFAQNCESVPLYIGNITLLWYATEVPLADLNTGLLQSGGTPLQIQPVTGITPVPPGGESIVPIPAGPTGANFVVVEYTVSGSATLASPANTVDYAQYAVAPGTPPPIPVFGRTGLMVLILLVAGSGLYFVRMKTRKITPTTV
jgi:hypothetical protein